MGDKLVDVHSVGQIKVCAENNRNLKKSSKQNTYDILQQLIGLAPQQLLVLGMNMEIIYIHSVILQVCSLLFEHFVEPCACLFFLVFRFSMYGEKKYVVFILQTEALPPANQFFSINL